MAWIKALNIRAKVCDIIIGVSSLQLFIEGDIFRTVWALVVVGVVTKSLLPPSELWRERIGTIGIMVGLGAVDTFMFVMVPQWFDVVGYVCYAVLMALLVFAIMRQKKVGATWDVLGAMIAVVYVIGSVLYVGYVGIEGVGQGLSEIIPGAP